MGNLVVIHTPECDASATGKRDFDCCNGNRLLKRDERALSRIVSLRLFPFDALSDQAKKVAIHRERQARISEVQSMAEAYAAQEFKGIEVAYVEYPYREVATALDGGPPLPSVLDKGALGPSLPEPTIAIYSTRPANYDCVVKVLAEEIPLALSDAKMIEHIKADNLEFLADGTLWVYADKEQP